jgi:hypothetical protein
MKMHKTRLPSVGILVLCEPSKNRSGRSVNLSLPQVRFKLPIWQVVASTVLSASNSSDVRADRRRIGAIETINRVQKRICGATDWYDFSVPVVA